VLTTLLVVLAIDLVAVYLNRLGKIAATGILTIITIEAGLLGTLLTLPGGAGPSDLPLFDLMTQAEIVAVAMLAPGWVFAIMGLNIVIILGVLRSGAVSPELSHLLAITGSTIIVQAINLQIIIGIFAFILVRSANLAILRLDRAEEIVALEKAEIERQEREIEQKRQLDQGIEQILQVLLATSNGNFEVQAPVSQENVLWRIAYALNNLLARLRSLKREEVELERARKEIYALRMALQKRDESVDRLEQTEKAARCFIESIQSGKITAVPIGRSGTVIDNIATALRTAQLNARVRQ